MFSHITVGTRDLMRAGRFYDAVLEPLGLRRRVVTPDGGPASLCWVSVVTLPRFYVYMPHDGQQAFAGNGNMTAFVASSAALVQDAWSAGLANGGADEGAPGERPRYGAGYFGAYLRDPDGNKIHIVHRGDLYLQDARQARQENAR